VLLCAVEGEDLELRPKFDSLIRRLIALGWIRIAQAWQDEVPIQPGDFDRVLRDHRSWHGGNEYDVVLATTPEGEKAIASGVLDEAYAKIPRPKESPIGD